MQPLVPSVVCVSVKNIRPEYSNLKEWMEDENNVYIGRKGIVFIEINGKKQRYPGQDSIWANPYKIGSDGDREEVLKKYARYITRRLIEEPGLLKKLRELKGKTLGCWCKPQRCHGDILIKMANKC